MSQFDEENTLCAQCCDKKEQGVECDVCLKPDNFAVKAWEHYDKKIQQEVGWLQHRNTILCTIQSLLFTSFCLVYSREFHYFKDNSHLLIGIAVFGVVLCVVIYMGIVAGNACLNNIQAQFERKIKCEQTRKKFPSLRTKPVMLRIVGATATWGPCIIFFLGWLLILIYIWLEL